MEQTVYQRDVIRCIWTGWRPGANWLTVSLISSSTYLLISRCWWGANCSTSWTNSATFGYGSGCCPCSFSLSRHGNCTTCAVVSSIWDERFLEARRWNTRENISIIDVIGWLESRITGFVIYREQILDLMAGKRTSNGRSWQVYRFLFLWSDQSDKTSRG